MREGGNNNRREIIQIQRIKRTERIKSIGEQNKVSNIYNSHIYFAFFAFPFLKFLFFFTFCLIFIFSYKDIRFNAHPCICYPHKNRIYIIEVVGRIDVQDQAIYIYDDTSKSRTGEGEGGEGILTWINKKRMSGIVCIFKGTNLVNGPYQDLLRQRALWQLSRISKGLSDLVAPLGQWVMHRDILGASPLSDLGLAQFMDKLSRITTNLYNLI